MCNSIFRRWSLIKRIKSNSKRDENGCWIWQGSTSGKDKPGKSGRGYGRISIKSHNSAVHRVMYICKYGYIPNKIDVDHLCNNRLCCNPKHLEAVTAKKNQKRKLKRIQDAR